MVISPQDTIPNSPSFRLVVDDIAAGSRLDHFLVATHPSVSRAILIDSIRSGLVTVDLQKRKSSYRLKLGEVVSGEIKRQPSPSAIIPQKMELEILFEDEYLLAVSKPPGVVVHPGCGNSEGTLVNGLVAYCHDIAGVGEGLRPGIVHRLDKDTSGILLVAKQNSVHRKLAEDFKFRRLKKEYLALLHGIFVEKSGRLVAAIGRHPVHRQKMAIFQMGGRFAATSWQVKEEFENRFTFVTVNIETGRTHQIRVHMASLGHPVAGDRLYGSNKNNQMFLRQLLHAFRLTFTHPVTGEALSITAPLWQDFEETLRSLREKGDAG